LLRSRVSMVDVFCLDRRWLWWQRPLAWPLPQRGGTGVGAVAGVFVFVVRAEPSAV
jgi:hypothetical protein